MNECKDCIQVKNLEDRIKSVWNAINETKGFIKDFEKRITDLEIAKSESRKDIERIFDAIETIEKNIVKIADAMEAMKSKDIKTYDNLKYEVIKYIVLAGLAFAMAKLF
ncbi:hypothetical protein [Tepidibacter thalassicus]|uniref:Uncharacterized protein n=2 Tax=Tepidibacter TaxID=214904 RepID=A0A1M5NMM8_9FIRM|nr:hypothetical protein [Tepidibacter thalassicus]SHG90834.1 hypothetical protein SAMN02744040_00125 [Tepidibacter thalassicus DSM 15285]SHK14341.1 hypothetical protein SAMN02744037_01723 [Tepidibacter formicigenes DSM 15518]